MTYSDRSNAMPYLRYAFISYLLLGVTDTVHHLHAAWALEQSNAIHAAAIGMLLVPIAIAVVFLYSIYNKIYLLWVFLAIALLAIVVPGFYHGGWQHLVKVLAHLRISSPSTELSKLFPATEPSLWFYEITGLFEFIFAVVCSYFVFMLMRSGACINPK